MMITKISSNLLKVIAILTIASLLMACETASWKAGSYHCKANLNQCSLDCSATTIKGGPNIEMEKTEQGCKASVKHNPLSPILNDAIRAAIGG